MGGGIEVRSDCSRCAALCCIAYPSDDMPGFAAIKARGEPCPKLDVCGMCEIYETRKESGFSGCADYECFGAGQHVVQHLFKGIDWRDDPRLKTTMVDAFLAMRPISDLLFLVDYAAKQLPASHLSELEALQAVLQEQARTLATLTDRAPLLRAERRLRALLQSVPR